VLGRYNLGSNILLFHCLVVAVGGIVFYCVVGVVIWLMNFCYCHVLYIGDERIEDRNMYIIRWLDKCWVLGHLPSCGTYNFRSMQCVFVSLFENPGSATLATSSSLITPTSEQWLPKSFQWDMKMDMRSLELDVFVLWWAWKIEE
jgi:hypothetical protein